MSTTIQSPTKPLMVKATEDSIHIQWDESVPLAEDQMYEVQMKTDFDEIWDNIRNTKVTACVYHTEKSYQNAKYRFRTRVKNMETSETGPYSQESDIMTTLKV